MAGAFVLGALDAGRGRRRARPPRDLRRRPRRDRRARRRPAGPRRERAGRRAAGRPEGTDHGGRGRGPGGTRGRDRGPERPLPRRLPKPPRSAREAGRSAESSPRPPAARRDAPGPTPFPSADERAHARRAGASTGTWVLRIAAVARDRACSAAGTCSCRTSSTPRNAYEQSVAAVLDVAAQPGSHDRDPDRGGRQRRVRPGRDQRVRCGHASRCRTSPRRAAAPSIRPGRSVATASRSRSATSRSGNDGTAIARGDRCRRPRRASSWR